MLLELFHWWARQMGDIAAPLTRRGARPAPDAMIVKCEPGSPETWHIFRRRRGALARLAAVSADSGDAAWRQAFASRRRREPVVIALPQQVLLRRTSVPAAAVSGLDRLLHYEMDRLTPFAIDDVLFSHRVRGNAAGGMVEVEIAVAPKVWVRDLLERLAVLSIRPMALEASAPDNVPRRISLDHADPGRRARTLMFQKAAFGTCAVLAAVAVAVPFVLQSMALADIEDRIALLQPRMDQVDALRARIAAGSAGAGQLAAARDQGVAALRVMGVLTDLLPDDTYLTNLVLRRRQLTMEGRSAAATKLIASLTAESYLKNPSFVAPVVRGDNGTDVFTIQAGFGS